MRQAKHLSGLLPPAQADLHVEIERAKAALEMRSTELEKYQAGPVHDINVLPKNVCGDPASCHS